MMPQLYSVEQAPAIDARWWSEGAVSEKVAVEPLVPPLALRW